ncbi:MAG: hypothetical protein Q9M26_04450 [Mariprofundales bacterium]|nr:hypothetical protein [Mariprofundales bacterium]
MLYTTVLYAAILALPQIAAAQPSSDMVEMLGTAGSVNWSKATVEARGIGVPPDNIRYQAKRNALSCLAAKVDAQRNLLETTQGVRIDSTTLIRDAMVSSDLVRSSIRGTLRAGARILRRQLQPDGSCVVTMSLPLQGHIASAVYHQQESSQVSLTNRLSTWMHTLAPSLPHWMIPEAEAAVTAPPMRPAWQDEMRKFDMRLSRIESWLGSHRNELGSVAAKGDPTGLIIDARGSNFIPSMSPVIRQIRGGPIYPDSHAKQQAEQHGQLISLFMRDIMMAQKHPRVGERPIILKALRTWGTTRTSLVLGKASSKRLQALIHQGFLKNAGVIVVMD